MGLFLRASVAVPLSQRGMARECPKSGGCNADQVLPVFARQQSKSENPSGRVPYPRTQPPRGKSSMNGGLRLWVCTCGHLWLYASGNHENPKMGYTNSKCCLCMPLDHRTNAHLHHCRTPGHGHPERTELK